jgi:hypothetical protein
MLKKMKRYNIISITRSMKMVKNIPIEQLLPNPYRNLDEKYFKESVILELVKSMQDTGVWAGIIARPKGKKYEIAFGHHRLEAMKRLEIKEAPIDVQENLSELFMLKMMIYENGSGEDEGRETKVVIDEIGKAKNLLEKELKNINNWSELTSYLELRGIFKSKRAFDTWKGKNNPNKEVGKDILTNYLGVPYLTNINNYIYLTNTDKKDVEIDLQAAELFVKPGHAKAFVKYVNDEKIEKDEQMPLAEKIIDRIEKSITDEDKKELGINKNELTIDGIRNTADHLRYGQKFANKELIKPDMDQTINHYIRYLDMVATGMSQIFNNWDDINPSLQRDYISEFQKLYKVHQNFMKTKGEKSCEKPLLLSTK